MPTKEIHIPLEFQFAKLQLFFKPTIRSLKFFICALRKIETS
jgi:hypothetical protein